MNYNLNKDPLFQILQATAIERLGILPHVLGQERLDVNRKLEEQADVLDARTTKRKFRKAWRKAAKRLVNKAGASKRAAGVKKFVAAELGLGSPAPTRRNKLARKREVALMVRAEALSARKTLMSTP